MFEPQAWYAIQVISRREGEVCALLLDKGYGVFRPTYFRISSRIGRLKEASLFPGYVFCQITSESRGRILTTSGVLRIVSYGGVPACVDEQELGRIRRLVASPVMKSPWRYLPNGLRVRIGNGPLEGLVGILDRRSGKLIVSVTILQRSVAAELDLSTQIVPLDGGVGDETGCDESSSLAVALMRG